MLIKLLSVYAATITGEIQDELIITYYLRNFEYRGKPKMGA